MTVRDAPGSATPDDPSTRTSRAAAAQPPPGAADSATPAGERVPQVAEEAAAVVSGADTPLGRPGRPLNRRSPFFVGLLGAAGVAVTYVLVQLIVVSRGVLILVGLALFLAIGLEPGVRVLTRWLPR